MKAFFDISEMAKTIGLKAGEKRNFYMRIDGEYTPILDEPNYKIIITTVRVTEAKNGHTTLKVFGYWNDERCKGDGWYKGEVDFGWFRLTKETLEAIQTQILK